MREHDNQFFVAYLKQGDVVIGVGANIGALTLAAATIVGNAGAVFAIEAHPVIFYYLQKNIELNDMKNIFLFNVAISSMKGSVSFSNKRADDMNEVTFGNGLNISAETLDDLLFETVEAVDLLKVDVEGFEKFVFLGAKKILDKTNCVYFESCARHFSKSGYTTADIIAIMTSFGFKLYKYQDGQTIMLSNTYVSSQCENLLAIKDVAEFSQRLGNFK